MCVSTNKQQQFGHHMSSVKLSTFGLTQSPTKLLRGKAVLGRPYSTISVAGRSAYAQHMAKAPCVWCVERAAADEWYATFLPEDSTTEATAVLSWRTEWYDPQNTTFRLH